MKSSIFSASLDYWNDIQRRRVEGLFDRTYASIDDGQEMLSINRDKFIARGT